MKKEIKEKCMVLMTTIIICVLIAAIFSNCKKQVRAEAEKIAVPASPGIIYTDVNPDSAILKTNPSSFYLDVNNDGINDFVFNATKGTCGDNFSTPLISYTYFSAGGGMIMTNHAPLPNVFNLAAALDSSTTVSPNSFWVSTSELLYGATGGYGRCARVYGYWLNASDKYLGLKFIKGNSIYYGWARLTSSYSATAVPYRHLTTGQLILKDYAYNSIPNQPILAGQKR